jgi:hypothetical protein
MGPKVFLDTSERGKGFKKKGILLKKETQNFPNATAL